MNPLYKIEDFYRQLRNWTPEEDQRVKEAIARYETDYKDQFPKDPFSGSCSISQIKHEYLADLDRTAKQIRERWLNHLSPKLKSPVVLKEDEKLVLEVYARYIKEKSTTTTSWIAVAREIYHVFEKQVYYSDNSIKNFCIRQNRKKVLNREFAGENDTDFVQEENSISVKNEKKYKKQKLDEKFDLNSFCSSSLSRVSQIAQHESVGVFPSKHTSLSTAPIYCQPQQEVNHANICDEVDLGIPHALSFSSNRSPIERQVTFSDPSSIAVYYSGGAIDSRIEDAFRSEELEINEALDEEIKKIGDENSHLLLPPTIERQVTFSDPSSIVVHYTGPQIDLLDYKQLNQREVPV